MANNKLKETRCDLCDVVIPSADDEMHVNGKRHQNLFKYKQMLQEQADCSIFVRGFSRKVSQEELSQVFGSFGTVSNIFVNRENSHYAIIKFSDKVSAQHAISHSGQIRVHDHCLTVKPKQLKPLKAEHSNIAPANQDEKSDDKMMNGVCSKVSKKDQSEENNVLMTSLKSCKSVELQVETLVRHFELTADDYAAQNKICDELRQLFNKHLQGFVIHIFGSSANMLGVRGCDLDIFLDLSKAVILTESLDSSLNVRKLSAILRKDSLFSDVIAITKARCPVIKFRHVASGIDCDISIDNSLALRNTDLIRLFVTSDERVRHLVYVVRHWAKMAGVTGCGPSGLTNYALTLIVIFYLQNTDPPFLPSVGEMSKHTDEKCVINGWDCSFAPSCVSCTNNLSQSQLIVDFFQFMAHFNFNSYAMSTRSGRAIDLIAFSKEITANESIAKFKISPMCVQDPFVLEHNTASNVNEKLSTHIRHQFQLAALRCNHSNFTRFDLDDLCRGLAYLLSPAAAYNVSDLNDLQSTRRVVSDNHRSVQSVSITFCLSKLSSDSSCRQAAAAAVAADDSETGGMVATRDAWVQQVVAITRSTLVEILGISCTTIDQPTDELLAHLGGIQSSTVNKTTDEELLAKRHEVADDCRRNDGEPLARVDAINSSSTSVSTQEQLVGIKRCLSWDDHDKPLKRIKANDDCNGKQLNCWDIVENMDVPCSKSGDFPDNAGGISELTPKSLPINSDCLPDYEFMFVARCSVSLRLWEGRKKIRQQLTHIADHYERELEVTKVLRSKLSQTATQASSPVMNFEMVVYREIINKDTVTIAMCPAKHTPLKSASVFKTFSICYKALLLKLVEKCITGIE